VAVVDAVDPIQGICYAPLPCLTNCHASMDIGQSGYENLWASSGRDDLGIMARMGAKSLRVYHPIGEPTQPEPDHAPFLDAVRSAGLSMFAAVHQYLTCPEDNCYDSWNTAVADGLAKGFEEGGKWHSAVWAVNMINEVDAIVPFDAPERQVMRLISAVDGLLAAEMAAKVTGEVKLTSCFTTAIAVPLGGGAATVYHGFSSIEAWIKNPGLVPYTPRSMTTAQLAAAIDSRWVHCANAQIPWSGLKAMIADHYAPFLPRPWFIGEMGFNGASASDITTQLTEMNEYTSEGKGFLGSYMFQFQTAYEKTGSELNFGMFSLGGETLFEAGVVEGSTYDVRCLTSRLHAFDSDTSGCPACNHSGCCFWRHSLGHWSLPRYAASWSRRWCVHATGPGSLSDWGTRALLSWKSGGARRNRGRNTLHLRVSFRFPSSVVAAASACHLFFASSTKL